MPVPFELNGNGWAKTVATVGLPTLLAIALTGFLMYNITEAHANMATQLYTVQKTVDVNQAYLKDVVRSWDTLIRISRQTCLNTAPDLAARARCME